MPDFSGSASKNSPCLPPASSLLSKASQNFCSNRGEGGEGNEEEVEGFVSGCLFLVVVRLTSHPT